MSFNDGSGSLTTQLNNAAALVNNAAQSIINVAECDDFPDEPTQTRISRKEAREYENRIKETLPIALAEDQSSNACKRRHGLIFFGDRTSKIPCAYRNLDILQ